LGNRWFQGMRTVQRWKLDERPGEKKEPDWGSREIVQQEFSQSQEASGKTPWQRKETALKKEKGEDWEKVIRDCPVVRGSTVKKKIGGRDGVKRKKGREKKGLPEGSRTVRKFLLSHKGGD